MAILRLTSSLLTNAATQSLLSFSDSLLNSPCRFVRKNQKDSLLLSRMHSPGGLWPSKKKGGEPPNGWIRDACRCAHSRN